MELTDFIKHTVSTPEEAKNLLSLLIGFNLSGNNTPSALLSLYESFPNSYKENKKLFASVFYKFFMKYEMKNEYLQYFDDFHSFWASSEQEKIKQKNKDLFINSKIKQYKNSLEFSKALSVYNDFHEDIFMFLDKNNENIFNLCSKNKDKFIENLHKHNCWENILISDYSKFKSFCDKYEINHLNILKEQYATSYYGFKYLIHKITDTNLLFLMEDIHKDITFFENSSFFLENKNKRQKNQLNVFQFCLLLIKDEKHKSFNFVYNHYQKEIVFCLKSYFTEKEQTLIDIDSKNWILAIDIMLENNKHKFNQEPLNEFEIIQIKNTINSTAIIDAILLDNNLKVKPNQNNKRVKV